MGCCSCCKSIFNFWCGCCSHATHDPKSTTLVNERGCTDKLILLLFILACAGSVVVISTAAAGGGNPEKITNGIDMYGRICGVSGGVKDKPLAALVNPLTTDSDAFSVWTCVKTCNDTKDPDNDALGSLYGSSEFFGYCVPTFDVSLSGGVDIKAHSQFDAQFDSAAQNITRGMSDLANAWGIILASVFFALFFSYVYIWLSRKMAGVIIWLCILLVVLAGFFVGYSFLMAAKDGEAAGDTFTVGSVRRVQAYRVAGYIFIGATSLFVLVILGLSGQIRIAVEVVKEGSRAINDMRAIVFTPLLPLLIAGGYMVYWIYGALFIFSVSDLHTKDTPDDCLYYSEFHPKYDALTPQRNGNPGNYSYFDVNSSVRPLAAYWVFHGLWTIQLCVYFGYMVIAGAVCAWYFTLKDADGNRIVGGENGGTRAPLVASLWRTVRYHMGTVAFAALIIATVKFIRVTVKYIEMKTRSNPPNYLQKAIFCIIQCFLKCIECCLDKISRNALVWTAMWGDPFLPSAFSSFALIWRNLARVAAVHVVSDVILAIGKLAIAGATVGLSAIILSKAEPWKNTVSSAFVPCVLIAFLAYFVSWLFFLTFETVVDTTFLCFLVDSENSEKNKEAMFASKGLQELVGKYQLRSAMESEHLKKEAAERYAAIGGHKVQDDHKDAVAQLNRAVTLGRAESNEAAAANNTAGAASAVQLATGTNHKQAWN